MRWKHRYFLLGLFGFILFYITITSQFLYFRKKSTHFMKRKKHFSATDGKSVLKRTRLLQFDGDQPRLTSLVIKALPVFSLPLIGDFLSNNKYDPVKYALCGVQPMTLCLSQDVDSPLGTCWCLGFLPSEHQWGSRYVKVDKQFSLTDVEACLRFFSRTNSIYCRIAVEVLVVKLSMTSSDSPSAFDDLRNTIVELKEHLDDTKHVVFSITEHSSCCFTLNNSIGKATGLAQANYRQQVLLQMIDDLETCWDANHTLTPQGLFAFYFTSGVQPASEMHLAKLVISLNDFFDQDLSEMEVSQLQQNNKVMLVTSLLSQKDFLFSNPDAGRLCRFIRLDASALAPMQMNVVRPLLAPAGRYQKNPFIERIVINSNGYPLHVKLPQPSAPLIDSMRLSSLIELTLKGDGNTLHLSQLNSGYFPRLAHLSVTGGNIKGCLDSQNVPCLKTLFFDLGNEDDRSHSDLGYLVHERAESLIHAGRPWQLVATNEPGGWSLASYNELATDPQDEVKDDLIHPHSLPLIKELLLVSCSPVSADGWQLQLNGNLSLEAAADDHSDRSLVWAPERVEKITVFCTSMTMGRLEFKEEIHRQTRILSSFTCYNVNVVLDGAVLPNLQLLELNGGIATMSGLFPHLESLSFKNILFQSQWLLNAPLLTSLRCSNMLLATHLSLRPQLLPYLSFLQIQPRSNNAKCFPDIFVGEDDVLGLSRVEHVVFGKNMTLSPFFNQCQVNHVLHLELTVDPLQLPECWVNTVWQCETLTIDICPFKSEHVCSPETTIVTTLPSLPRVKKLTVTKENCHVLLNTEMPELADCTVPTPRSLGPNLRCPALKRIRFTDDLSESDKNICLDPATYVAIGAQPRDVIFAFDYQMHTIACNIVPNQKDMLPLDEPLEEVD